MTEDGMEKTYTCTAPVNIAVIKYWGKRDEDLILPINSSLSVTLHQDQLKTTTTVAIGNSFQEDRIWLNGKEEDISHPRLQSCLREIRRLARKRRNDADPGVDSTGLTHKVHICSINNFPTAAGLASSAAGFACLVYTLAQAFGVEGELSVVARQGSGSACRSMYGGFVQWLMGHQSDGKDSLAQQHRAESVVPGRMVEMIKAVHSKDFTEFAELTMKDSNQFHATCLDTYPPIIYLNRVSHQVINLVHRYNHHYGETRVAYTFDAGPNAVIFTLEQHIPDFIQAVRHFFPPETNGGEFIKGLPVPHADLSEELKIAIGLEPMPKGISYIISTKPGPGPCVVRDPTQHLLGPDGLPKNTVRHHSPETDTVAKHKNGY
ncbi:diphosphomevalonate decarboxylase isoform X2 [Corythoichthys intestinalis]|uniref:diphosphomevalonate decarboxylase isoform X2 n=1 Tax=Corythoichthys intestinalis TaxID=161448 RepID=UPI0025A57B00|nr:diphosphomevalonate decarboxylase isoform X2 [Corythoichthys intestinalis]